MGDLPATFRLVSAPLAVVVACATLFAGRSAVAATSADDICLPGGPACEAPVSPDEPAEYATPAVVNCPSVDLRDTGVASADAPAFDVRAVSWDCSPPNLLFHYRVSRVPETERPSGALRPERGRIKSRPIASCTGLPPEHGAPLSVAATQPMAMYATFALIPPPMRAAGFESMVQGPTRVLEPLDRPPRA
jgi:hypothetical protein